MDWNRWLRASRTITAATVLGSALACGDPASETVAAPEPAAPEAPPQAVPAPLRGESSPDGAESSAAAREGAAALDRSPLGVFEGTLPCADCEGIKTELTLYLEPDLFELKETYVGGSGDGKTAASGGSWTTLIAEDGAPEGTIVRLNPDKAEETRSFLEVGSDRLEQLDRDGKRIPTNLNYSLTRRADPKAGS